MESNEPLKYIEKIVLEIVDRFWFHQWRDRRIEKFNITRFNPKEAAYAFLRQYDGESFVKAQKIIVWYNNQELHLCVRDLVYGKINKNSNSTVEFIYRKAMFSEIKWPVITVNRINRVRWAADNNNELSTMSTEQSFQGEIPEIHHPDEDCSSINVDEPVNVNTRVVPCISCNNLEEDQSLLMNDAISENTINSFCRECRVRRSVSGLEKLINNDGQERNVILERDTNDESHFRTSIHIQVNHNKNP